VQHHLVAADDPGVVGLAERLLLGGRAGRPERVVVQHEQRCHGDGPAGARPDGVRVFRGEHAEVAAHLDEGQVTLLAAEPHRVRAVGPELVVARRPDHGREAVAQQGQGAADVVEDLPDVAGHDQPVVVAVRAQALDDAPVLRIADVQVADREQGGLHGRCSHRCPVTGAPIVRGPYRAVTARLSKAAAAL
jgi:hypothetical protein